MVGLFILARPFFTFYLRLLLVFHCLAQLRACSSVAYMKAVEGDLGDSFKSLEACADIVKRYPGSVRFRFVGY